MCIKLEKNINTLAHIGCLRSTLTLEHACQTKLVSDCFTKNVNCWFIYLFFNKQG